MEKSDKKYISNTLGLISTFSVFIFQTNFKQIFPFLNNGIILLGFALLFGIFISKIVYHLLPGLKTAKKNQKQNSSKITNSQIKGKREKLSDSQLLKTDLFSLEGEDFEKLCFMYFEDHGFMPQKTKVTGDHGVDLVIKDPKDGMKIAVQCKRWKDKSVGNHELLILESGKRAYKCIGTLFITTSTYTKAAHEYADAVRMDLWNGLIVKDKIGKWQNEKLRRIS